jgi:putative ABC transport system permease protein
MAWRDARLGLKPLLLAAVCIVLGVGSVVTAYSFRDNLNSSVQNQSKSLLGADLAIESREPFSAEDEALLASIEGAQSRQVSFSSMAYFPENGASRLVQVRAIRGGFPYYGALETDPPSAAANFRGGANALVDESIMLQFGAEPGDALRIGDQEFRIAGKLKKIPGETVVFSLISPRVYIPLDHLHQLELLQKGSIVRYRALYKLRPEADPDLLVQGLSGLLEQLQLQAETVSRRAARIGSSLENLSRYLRLAVFIAVLLSGVGIASGVHLYVKGKTSTVAILRCLGATPRDTVAVYLLQTSVVACAGAVAGALIGSMLQTLLPLALKDFLPVTAEITVAPFGILAGIVVGLGTTLLFSLVPLLPLRTVSPLLALRASYESATTRDALLWLVYGLIILSVAVFGVRTTGSWLFGLWFTAGVTLVFGLLVALARGLAALLKKISPRYLPFPWRQGLANLYRPNNQTTALILAVGLATFLLVTMYSVRHQLVAQVAAKGGAGEGNLVLFDVQQNQLQELAGLLASLNIGVREQVPVVTMRIAAVNDRPVEELRRDPAADISYWALRREYRSTYRSHLTPSEKLLQGTWHRRVDAAMEPIPVSLERGIAESLRLQIGDHLDFDVQGVQLRTRVASLREVDWQTVRANFFVVFPEGVLEAAPHFYVMLARAPDPETAAAFQRRLVERHGNVSVIDLTLILNTLNAVLGRVSYAVRFIAAFTILAGCAVLAGAILSNRAQRIRESILLRTLGAPRSKILTAVAAEYVFAGGVAAAAGTVLALAASWGLSTYFFESVPQASSAPLMIIPVAITLITMGAGVLGCWGLFRRSALETLRAEA